MGSQVGLGYEMEMEKLPEKAAFLFIIFGTKSLIVSPPFEYLRKEGWPGEKLRTYLSAFVP